MNETEFNNIHTGVVFTEDLYNNLKIWIKKYYVGNLIYDDIFVPSFILKCRNALNELSNILKLENLYDFQKKQ
jgi:succinylarginine dihydrolase